MSRAITRAQLDKLVRSITKFYPQKYADKSWDNTGLLIDCSTAQVITADANAKTKVLLTVDLTKSVAQEAVDANCNVIVAYHPFIFPSWNRLSPHTNPQHETAIKLIQYGISVYCPHTAVDAARGGVNDWLVRGLNNGENVAKSYALETVSGETDDLIGYGRFVEFNKDISLEQIVKNVKRVLRVPYVQVASLAAPSAWNQLKIKKVAVCAGSGSGVFKQLKEDVDLYYTGEMSHHEVLKWKEMGKTVIVCNHSNTERGFLQDVMKGLLQDEGHEVVVSKMDCDPLTVA
ncbi:Nif3p [Saccharomyces cerevisiae YJM1273]|nr:Nif3p [Saccharomyces cerevisiae YJM1434]AJS19147.1 Nif3p [Saccharomyces cerevisiae YJM1273]CAI4447952.1 AVI_1a_G0017960.mRNA.1.CDS.1 [Saccharomyces cerevisiae]CAI4469821.1 ANE_G0018030.mRNA.1.CDS.1 [Saccharomyces cerevisiae]CAI6653220.1 ANE_G0018030.mRNA.1.CDS.1 [Saccharomyces cerevisiae]